MRPNVDDNSVFFRCKCADDHFLEVSGEPDENALWLHFIDRPQNATEAFRRWWRERSLLWADVGLTREDVVALRDALNKWLSNNEQGNR